MENSLRSAVTGAAQCCGEVIMDAKTGVNTDNPLGLKDPGLLRQANYINGDWVAAADGATLEVRNPATGAVIGTVPKGGKGETRRAIEAAERAPDRLACAHRQGAPRHPDPLVRPDDGKPGGSCPHHDGRGRQAARGSAWRDRLWRELHPVVRRGGQARLWRHDPLAQCRAPADGDQAACGRLWRDHAVELPPMP